MAEPENHTFKLAEPEEGEEPVARVENPWSSLNTDLDISTSGSKSSKARGDGDRDGDGEEDRDDYDDDDGGRATMAKTPCLQKKHKLGEPEGEDLQGFVKTRAVAFSIDHVLEMAIREALLGKKARALPRKKTRAFPRVQKGRRVKSTEEGVSEWFDRWLPQDLDYEKGEKKDDHDEYDDDGERATTAKISHPPKNPNLGEQGREFCKKGLIKTWTSEDTHLDISTYGSNCTEASNPDLSSSSDFEEGDKKDDHDNYDDVGGRATTAISSRLQKKPKLGEPGGEDVQGLVKTKAPAFSIDHILDMEMAKCGEQKGEDLQWLVKTRADVDEDAKRWWLKMSEETAAKSSRLQKKPKLGEPEVEDVQGLVKAKAPAFSILDMEMAKRGEPKGEDLQGLVKTRADEDAKRWWLKMSKERVSPWFDRRRRRDLDYERPKFLGWGYSDVDKNDPLWHDKFVEEIRRETPRKYKVALEKAYCPPGVEKKDEALWERYLKQIEESDGYDITDFPGITILTPITPLIGFKQSPSDFERFRRFTVAAITEFNSTREENDQYEVHDILTVNVSPMGLSILHYITFEAKKKSKDSNASATAKEEDDHGGATLLTTFQARVLQKIVHTKVKVEDEVKVEECRIKALKPSPA